MNENTNTIRTFLPPVWFMNGIYSIHRFLIWLSRRILPPSITMVNHIENFWFAKALATAAELNIATHIKNGYCTIESLSEITNTNRDALFRLMRMLCANDIFILDKSNRYRLTAFSKTLLEEKDSVKYLLQSHLSKTNLDIFSEMKYTLETGKNAAQKLYNSDIFSFIHENPDQLELFNKGMSDTSELFAPVLLASYNFSDAVHIFDIGGGDGSLLRHILLKYPHAKGTLYDNFNVIEHALSQINGFGLSNRLSVSEGNFFKQIPTGGDIYLLKNILHDWGNEDCQLILRNIESVISSSSRLLVIECIINNNNRYSYGKMLDIMMLLGTHNGRERTLEEFTEIFDNSGFKINRIIPTISPFSLIECIKKN